MSRRSGYIRNEAGHISLHSFEPPTKCRNDGCQLKHEYGLDLLGLPGPTGLAGLACHRYRIKGVKGRTGRELGRGIGLSAIWVLHGPCPRPNPSHNTVTVTPTTPLPSNSNCRCPVPGFHHVTRRHSWARRDHIPLSPSLPK